MTGFEGGIVLVTGAAGGIGAAVVRAFAKAGATVAAADRDATGVTELADTEDAVHGYPLDVADSSAVDACVDTIERTLGPIDVLANVAGTLCTRSVVDTTDEDWGEVFDVNVTGVFVLSRAVARKMIPRQRGSIVTVSSNAAGVPRMNMAGYGASKAAATMFTKSLGLELAAHGIRCNIVAPGSTDTVMQRQNWPAELSTQDARDSVVSGTPESFKVGIPLGKLADPEDISDSVVFLASDKARHITMHDMYVDGGATLKC